MNPPLRRFTPETYAFSWPDERVQLALDDVHEARGGELRALMTVKTTRNGHEQLLFQADFNLVSVTSRQTATKSLQQRIPQDQIDWSALLEQVCYYAREQWREGDPLIYLPTYEPPPGERFLLAPYIEQGGPSIVFAMGGTGKSLFALALAASVAAGVDIGLGQPLERLRVAYLDWETEPRTHYERLRALCAGSDIAFADAHIWYRHQAASLAAAAPHLRRQFAKDEIGLMIIDSLGAARGGEPESADSTIRLFNAARSIGIPWIGVDHMTKNGGGEQATPFGSVYTHNMARATWAMEIAETQATAAQTIVLTNKKANNGPLSPRRAYEVEYRSENDALSSVRYRAVDLSDVPGMAQRMPIADQIARLLREWGPLTVSELCSRGGEIGLDLKAPGVTAALKGRPKQFAMKAGSYPSIWSIASIYEEAS